MGRIRIPVEWLVCRTTVCWCSVGFRIQMMVICTTPRPVRTRREFSGKTNSAHFQFNMRLKLIDLNWRSFIISATANKRSFNTKCEQYRLVVNLDKLRGPKLEYVNWMHHQLLCQIFPFSYIHTKNPDLFDKNKMRIHESNF